MQLLSSSRSLAHRAVNAGTTPRHCLHTSTAVSQPGVSRRVTRVRCDSRDAVEVIAFTAEQLAQDVLVAEQAQQSNGHEHSNGSGSGNGHSNGNGHSRQGRYQVVSSSNGNGSSKSHDAPSNGNGNGHSSNGNGHSNGSKAAAASTAPMQSPAATAVDPDDLAAQAADAWAACVASHQIPGQQLSSTTFDCGVSVTISRSEAAAAPAAADSSYDQAGSSIGSMDAAQDSAPGGLYYVRVSLPPEFGRDCILHWGVENWQMPPTACRPPNSKQVRDRVWVRMSTTTTGVLGTACMTCRTSRAGLSLCLGTAA